MVENGTDAVKMKEGFLVKNQKTSKKRGKELDTIKIKLIMMKYETTMTISNAQFRENKLHHQCRTYSGFLIWNGNFYE